MEPKQKALSSLYDGEDDPVLAKLKKAKPYSKPRSKANPSIVLIDPNDKAVPMKQHPPPPRRLPATHFKKASTASSLAHASVEEEIDVDEEENQQLDEEENDVQGGEEDEMYLPSDEDDDNSYDRNDTMSEDGVLGEYNEVEQETLDISSGEDKGSAKSKKKRKKERSPNECIENSPAWEHFEKVMAHSKLDPEG